MIFIIILVVVFSIFFFRPLCVPPGFFAIMVSAIVVAVAVHQGADLTYIHSHFLQLATATFIISVLLSIYLYVRSRYAASEELALGGNSGKKIGYILLCPFICLICQFM